MTNGLWNEEEEAAKDKDLPSWETPGGKTLKLKRDEYGLFNFYFSPGGQVSPELGKFTALHLAVEAADKYISEMPPLRAGENVKERVPVVYKQPKAINEEVIEEQHASS